MKIVGVMRVCDEFDEAVDLTIGALASFCDEVCFLLHNLTSQKICDAITRTENVVGISCYIEEYGNCETVDAAYHLANKYSPDWVVMQDQDELLPFVHLRETIEEAEAQDCSCVPLSALACYNNPETIVWPAMSDTAEHCRLWRGGNKEFTVFGGGGSHMPKNAGKWIYGKYPYRHMNFMTKSCRERRRNIKTHRSKTVFWGMDEDKPPPTFPFREDWSSDRWKALTTY
jgi:hypothetical protein